MGSLFAGIGGFCKAFELEGCKVAWANDYDKYVKITYEKNYNNRFIFKDIKELSVTKDELDPVDILTAGFPCQPFSIAGNRKGFNDKERGNLFYEISRIINEFGDAKPKILLLENVKNFKKEEYISKVIEELNRVGYWIDSNFIKVLNTHELTDLPQNRERLFMIALNKDYFFNTPLSFPENTAYKKRKPFDLFNTKIKTDDYYYFKPHTKYWNLFNEQMDKYEKAGHKKVYLLRRWYVRPYLNGYTPTLTANMGTGGHNVPVIKDRWGIRKLTTRECARLQGFEDNWFIIPDNLSRTQIYKQIGNSVSIPLIRELAKICIKAIKDLKITNN
ncbi:MAG: DNA (cytosine-5-)-methyltransferase [Ignavibacteriales bacterium]|nr:DNA (cytosine-5-)-methyltransferase [Ignavibacteriales bacterium]